MDVRATEHGEPANYGQDQKVAVVTTCPKCSSRQKSSMTELNKLAKKLLNYADFTSDTVEREITLEELLSKADEKTLKDWITRLSQSTTEYKSEQQHLHMMWLLWNSYYAFATSLAERHADTNTEIYNSEAIRAEVDSVFHHFAETLNHCQLSEAAVTALRHIADALHNRQHGIDHFNPSELGTFVLKGEQQQDPQAEPKIESEPEPLVFLKSGSYRYNIDNFLFQLAQHVNLPALFPPVLPWPLDLNEVNESCTADKEDDCFFDDESDDESDNEIIVDTFSKDTKGSHYVKVIFARARQQQSYVPGEDPLPRRMIAEVQPAYPSLPASSATTHPIETVCLICLLMILQAQDIKQDSIMGLAPGTLIDAEDIFRKTKPNYPSFDLPILARYNDLSLTTDQWSEVYQWLSDIDMDNLRKFLTSYQVHWVPASENLQQGPLQTSVSTEPADYKSESVDSNIELESIDVYDFNPSFSAVFEDIEKAVPSNNIDEDCVYFSEDEDFLLKSPATCVTQTVLPAFRQYQNRDKDEDRRDYFHRPCQHKNHTNLALVEENKLISAGLKDRLLIRKKHLQNKSKQVSGRDKATTLLDFVAEFDDSCAKNLQFIAGVSKDEIQSREMRSRLYIDPKSGSHMSSSDVTSIRLRYEKAQAQCNKARAACK